MARTKKRLKIIIMGHRDSLSYLIVSCDHLNKDSTVLLAFLKKTLYRYQEMVHCIGSNTSSHLTTRACNVWCAEGIVPRIVGEEVVTIGNC